MYADRELCFVFEKENQDLQTGQIGDVIRTSWGQFKGRDVFLFAASIGETTATGDPAIKFILEAADNKEFDDSFEIPLPGEWSKKDLSGLDGRPCPVMRVPMSPPAWKTPKDIFYRCKLEVDGTIACTGKLTIGLTLDPQTNW